MKMNDSISQAEEVLRTLFPMIGIPADAEIIEGYFVAFEDEHGRHFADIRMMAQMHVGFALEELQKAKALRELVAETIADYQLTLEDERYAVNAEDGWQEIGGEWPMVGESCFLANEHNRYKHEVKFGPDRQWKDQLNGNVINGEGALLHRGEKLSPSLTTQFTHWHRSVNGLPTP